MAILFLRRLARATTPIKNEKNMISTPLRNAIYNEMLEIVRLFILRYCGNDIMPNLANWKR